MKPATLKCAAWSISLLTFLIALPAKAADLAYAGRLVDVEGAPLAGPVDITLRFFGSAAGGDQLGPTKTFDGIPLEGGVFQLTISLETTDQAAIFGDGTAVVFVEIEAAGKLYPRQRFTPVPLALRIPVDNDSLVYGSDAKLTVGEIAMGQVQGLQAALAQKLDSTPASASASGFLSSADWTTFNAKQAAITASSSLTAGSLTTASRDAVVIKPYGNQAGETGELRFEEKTGGNHVAFKAPDSLAASTVWTLPAADGAAGEVLATDGSGGLSWVALSGANILDATITDAKLQTITAPGKVSGAAITSGSIGGSAAFAGTGGVTTSGNITLSPASSAATELRFQDDDATNYVAFKAPSTVASNLVLTLPAADGAAGQFLKTDGAGALAWGSPAGSGDMLASANLSDLANAATARSNLGLGALATLASVGSAEITNGSVADADISASAAIATSKLSGPLTSVSGHGLGSLAALSAVSSTEITDGSIADADISGTAQVATSKLSGAVTAIAGHGLGTLATLGSVSSAEVDDGTIADADVSGTAAIATSKLAGAVTSISGHGLGSLATLSTVGSAQITDGQVADADISGTAAIATSKLSGSVTSITGHGLGALATSSTVTAAEITDGTIADADISGTAAIATSKLSGALTAVSGHGLGALANLSAVSATEITDDTITNADISATAAIDSSKIANGSVSSTEFQYLDGVTSSVQTQLDAKASAASPTFTGAISSALGSAAAPSYSFTGDSNTGVWSSTADTVNVSTAGNERLRVTSTGNVGVGTTAPTNKLSVIGSADFTGGVGIGTTAPASNLHVAGVASANVTIDSTSASAPSRRSTLTLYSQDAGPFRALGVLTKNATQENWFIGEGYGTNGNFTFGYGASQPEYSAQSKVMITTAGNVGIGTTNPSATLNVVGTTNITSNATIGGNATVSGNVDINGGVLSFMAGGQSGADVSSLNPGTTTSAAIINGPLQQHLIFDLHNNDAQDSIAFRYSSVNQYNVIDTIGLVMKGNGNVGIGTSSPLGLLDVRGAVVAGSGLNNTSARPAVGTARIAGEIAGVSGAGLSADDGFLRLSAGGGGSNTAKAYVDISGYSTVADMNNNVVLGTAGTERMRITSNGNVGIGTTSPNATLTVSKASDTLWNTPANFFTPDNVSTHYSQMHLGVAQTTGNATSLRFYYDADNSNANRTDLGFASVSTPVMSYTRGGNVGIGTTTPLSKLHVTGGSLLLGDGSTDFSSTTSYYMGRQQFATYTANSGFSGMELGGPASAAEGYLAFHTHDYGVTSGERMRIDKNGNVGIGTTAPGYKLHVVGTAGLSTGTAWTNASDIRLKDIAGDYDLGLDEIMQLHTVRFTYKQDNALGIPAGNLRTGFIAQEVREVIPEAVIERPDGFLELNVDPIHWAVVNAVKELGRDSMEQEAELGKLKAENEQLRAESEQLKAAFCAKFQEMSICSQ